MKLIINNILTEAIKDYSLGFNDRNLYKEQLQVKLRTPLQLSKIILNHFLKELTKNVFTN